MKKLLFSALIISLLAFGCSGTPSVKDSSSRAELTVTYYGDEVHRRGGEYVTGSELRDLIFNKKQEVFVIFTAPWCGACKIVKKAIKQANLDFKVHSKRNFAMEDFKPLETKDAIQSRIFWMGQLVCTNPRMQGLLVGGPTAY